MISRICNTRKCWVCGATRGLHKHHIFEGRNRNNSEREGLWCYLCGYHHNMSDEGVHFNKELDKELKIMAETKWCEEMGLTPDDFIKIFHRNYLE